MIREIEISLPEGLFEGTEAVLVPRPFDHWGQRLVWFEAEGVASVRETAASNSRCSAYLLTPAPGRAPAISFGVELGDGAAPDWVWERQDNRYTLASPSLMDLAQSVAEGSKSQRAALRRLIDEASAVFGYDHVDAPFNDGCDVVPAICGTAKGSCVDINTYLLAAARSLGIRGQYIAGWWLHPEKVETRDMHCWLAFEPDGELVFWDLAHALKWSETLGAQIEEGLNPAGGRRVASSCGRGLVFETGFGPVEISHFAEPVPLRRAAEGREGDGPEILGRLELVARVTDPLGQAVQHPVLEAAE